MSNVVAVKILKLMNQVSTLMDNHDLSWNDLIIAQGSNRKPALVNPYPDVEEMFNEIFEADLKPEAIEFVERLYDGYEQFGQLTPKQHTSLEENYERLILKPARRKIG